MNRPTTDNRAMLGLDENHEFTEFTEAVNFGACREF